MRVFITKSDADALHLEPGLGYQVSDVLADAVLLAQQRNLICKLRVNSVDLVIRPDSTVATLMQYFQAELDSQKAAYLASPEYKEAQAKRQAEVAALQVQIDALLEKLPKSGTDQAALMTWIASFADINDRIGLVWDHSALAVKLTKLNRPENATSPSAKERKGHTIVLRAIECLQEGTPIHPLICQWVKDYQAMQFGLTRELEVALAANDYADIREIDGVVCATHDYFTTRGIVVGANTIGYQRRYCYRDREEASRVLAAWDGKGHPPGNWIKVKGVYEGRAIDEFNPNFVD